MTLDDIRKMVAGERSEDCGIVTVATLALAMRP